MSGCIRGLWYRTRRNLTFWDNLSAPKIAEAVLFEDSIESSALLLVNGDPIVIDAEESLEDRCLRRQRWKVHKLLDQPSKDSKAIDVWISTSVEEPSLPFCSVWKIRGRPGHTCVFEQSLKCLM